MLGLCVGKDREGDGVVLEDFGLVCQDCVVALEFLPHGVNSFQDSGLISLHSVLLDLGWRFRDWGLCVAVKRVERLNLGRDRRGG